MAAAPGICNISPGKEEDIIESLDYQEKKYVIYSQFENKRILKLHCKNHLTAAYKILGREENRLGAG